MSSISLTQHPLPIVFFVWRGNVPEIDHQSDHWITEYERGGTSNRVRMPAVEGFSKGRGITRCGASKLLNAFRSSPVRISDSTTRDGALSSHSSSTSLAFERSRLSTNTVIFFDSARADDLSLVQHHPASGSRRQSCPRIPNNRHAQMSYFFQDVFAKAVRIREF